MNNEIVKANMERIYGRPVPTNIPLLAEVWVKLQASPYPPRVIFLHPRLLPQLSQDLVNWIGNSVTFPQDEDRGIVLFSVPVFISEFADKDHPEILINYE